MPHVISRDGTKIAFDQAGHGQPLVIVGGALSDRRFSKLVDLAERLSDRFTVVNYDRRGRGDSRDAQEYSVERELEDLRAVIDAIGGSASVWGWSSGAILAARAARAGVPIDSLMLYEPPFLVDDSRPVPPADLAAQLTELVQAGRRSAAVKLFFVKGMGMPSIIPIVLRLTPMWPRLKRLAHTIPYDWALLGDDINGKPLDPAEWSTLTARTLVMSGSKSPAQLRTAARALAEVLPNAEHRELERQSHNVAMKALAPVIADYVAGARRPVAAPDGQSAVA